MAGEPRDFGPYKLLRRLGVGGMAETFEATRTGAGGFEQRVCLKRVLPAFSADDEFISRFRREAQLAAQLRHSHVVGVIDFGAIDGVHYLTLELVDGVDLRSLLKSSPDEKLSPETVALIATDLAYALEHAHGRLVHRDISPSNILLSRSGEAKLADFGIAKAIENEAVTASRSAKGKIPYMSPEHMRGESVDGRADLFSLGVVLFEALAARRPFDGAHDVETMQKILSGDRLSLEDVAPEVPSALRDLVEHLIEVDPDARTPTAARLIEELALVAPVPRVRRELAATVESHRGGPSARLHVRAREEERDTELSRAGVLLSGRIEGTEPPKEGRGSKRGAWFLGAAMLMTVVVGLGVAQWVGGNGEAGTETGAEKAAAAAAGSVPGAAAETATESVAVSETAAVPAPGSETVPGSAPVMPEGVATAPAPSEPAPRLRKGWLHVVVQPWGNVWIDGTSKGRAPVKVRLSKGRHVVEAGRDQPSQIRVVRIGAGTRQEIEFNLPD